MARKRKAWFEVLPTGELAAMRAAVEAQADAFDEWLAGFDELIVRRPDGSGVALEEFAAGGRRWWDGLYAGDKRTDSHGIFPGGQTGRST